MLNVHFLNLITIFNIFLTSYASTTKSTNIWISRDIMKKKERSLSAPLTITTTNLKLRTTIPANFNQIFYPYGISNGDTIAPKSDDGFKWGDIYYRETTNYQTLSMISTDIQNINSSFSSFQAIRAIIITWNRVMAFRFFIDIDSISNLFQLALITNGSFSYAIYNHGKISWHDLENALAGHTAGDNVTVYQLPGSSSSNILSLTNLSNVNKPGQWIFRVDSVNDGFGILYPFGISNGDNIAPKSDDRFFRISIKPLQYFSKLFSTLYISSNGYISFGIGLSLPYPSYFQTNNYKIIAPFWSNIYTEKCGDIYYRETANYQTLSMISTDIQNINSSFSSFQAVRAIIITWDRVCAYNLSISNSYTNTFQLALITNGSISYAIYNYGKLSWHDSENAFAGYNAGDNVTVYQLPGSSSSNILSLTNLSNVNKAGQWVFRVDSCLRNELKPINNSNIFTRQVFLLITYKTDEYNLAM